MTLGELIHVLKAAKQDLVCVHGFSDPHSYRGYYEQLAFEPTPNTTVAEMLTFAQDALGSTYSGYKGGEYTMGEHTDVWLACYGCTGEAITSLTLEYMLGSWFSTFEEEKLRAEERLAMAAWLVDRMEQYSNESGIKAALEDLVRPVQDGEHMVAFKSGELDDIVARLVKVPGAPKGRKKNVG